MNTLAAAAAVMTLAATATTAVAESFEATPDAAPSQGYVGVGASLGIERAIVFGMYVDGGKRLGTTPLFVHGQLTGGKSGSDGSFVQLRSGVEGRACGFRGLACVFAGADVGYQRDRMVDAGLVGGEMTTVDAHDVILVPRAGFELGGKLRLRAAAEAPIYQRLNSSDDDPTWMNRGAGLALTLAVAGVF